MSQVAPSRQEVNSRMLWIQLLAGPVLWSAHFVSSYLLVEAFCQMGWNFSILGINGLSFILIVLTLLALIGTGLFALKSYRAWKNINQDHNLKDKLRETTRWSEGPLEFMYFTGLLLSLLFTATILMVGVPAIFLRPCARLGKK
ncbi:MAG TPA: hypothetical protein VFZ43_12105 [Anaerolineales bacterium]